MTYHPTRCRHRQPPDADAEHDHGLRGDPRIGGHDPKTSTPLHLPPEQIARRHLEVNTGGQSLCAVQNPIAAR
jgi:hypothetical protein